jgi:hypothetical protein
MLAAVSPGITRRTVRGLRQVFDGVGPVVAGLTTSANRATHA